MARQDWSAGSPCRFASGRFNESYSKLDGAADGDGTARHGRGTGVPTFPAGQNVRGPGLLPDGWGDGPHDDGMAALQVELCARRSYTNEAHKCGCDGRRSTLRKKRLIDWADRMRNGRSSGGAGKDVHGWGYTGIFLSYFLYFSLSFMRVNLLVSLRHFGF